MIWDIFREIERIGHTNGSWIFANCFPWCTNAECLPHLFVPALNGARSRTVQEALHMLVKDQEPAANEVTLSAFLGGGGESWAVTESNLSLEMKTRAAVQTPPKRIKCLPQKENFEGTE